MGVSDIGRDMRSWLFGPYPCMPSYIVGSMLILGRRSPRISSGAYVLGFGDGDCACTTRAGVKFDGVHVPSILTIPQTDSSEHSLDASTMTLRL